VDVTVPSITVEHISPQNPESAWRNSLAPEEYALFGEKFLNTVGNLTLSGNNGRLGKGFSSTNKRGTTMAESRDIALAAYGLIGIC